MRFSLNHAICPLLPIPEFLELAATVGVDTVELRDGMPPGWELPPAANVLAYAPAAIAELSRNSGIGIVSINALQRFDLWDRERADQARALIGFAATASIPNLVLCPSVAEPGSAAAESQLEQALDGLQPMLESSGVRALIEPLGFTRSSLRYKAVADQALKSQGTPACFGIVHDSFHHAIAGEQYYSPLTALVHLSGVADIGIPVEAWGDRHRILVDESDVMGNVEQVRTLMSTYDGVWSLEPFASEVGASPTLADDLRRSIDYISANA